MGKHKAQHSQQQKWNESIFSANLYSAINHQTSTLKQHFITMIYIHYQQTCWRKRCNNFCLCSFDSTVQLEPQTQHTALVRVNSSMPTVFPKECHRYFHFMLPSISCIFQTFSMVSGVLFPHHPDNTFRCMKSQLIKEAYSSLLDFGSNILLKEVFLR